MEKLSALFRAVWKALAMAWSSSLTSSPKPFSCVSSLLFPDKNSTSVADEKTLWEQLQEVSCKQQINEYCFSSRLASWKLKFSSSADSHGTNTFPHSSPNTCLSPWPSHSPSIAAAVGELLVMTILLGKEVTLCLSYLHSSWPSWKAYKVSSALSSPALKCSWAGSAVTRSPFPQGSWLKLQLKHLPLSGAVGSTVNFPAQ